MKVAAFDRLGDTGGHSVVRRHERVDLVGIGAQHILGHRLRGLWIPVGGELVVNNLDVFVGAKFLLVGVGEGVGDVVRRIAFDEGVDAPRGELQCSMRLDHAHLVIVSGHLEVEPGAWNIDVITDHRYMLLMRFVHELGRRCRVHRDNDHGVDVLAQEVLELRGLLGRAVIRPLKDELDAEFIGFRLHLRFVERPAALRPGFHRQADYNVLHLLCLSDFW